MLLSQATFGSMEDSFQAFLERPENRILVESYQRKEALKALKAKEKASALTFREKVLGSDVETQKALAPFLKNRALRKVIQTFTNDSEARGVSVWGSNKEVLRLLTEAKRLMDGGAVTEDEMEARLLAQLKSNSEAGAQLQSHQKITLGMEQLVSALNEHLKERRRGNEFYQSGNWNAAKYHYDRAKAIVDFVRGQGPDEQAEIDANRVAVLLNLAAVSLATREYCSAVELCSEALASDCGNQKGLLRRAKAHVASHNYTAAERDLDRLEERGSGESCAIEIGVLRSQLQRAKKAGQKADAVLFSRMLK